MSYDIRIYVMDASRLLPLLYLAMRDSKLFDGSMTGPGVLFVKGAVRTLQAVVLTLASWQPLSHAADVVWESPKDISADTDVSAKGTLERAFNFGSPTVKCTTINGVTFLKFPVSNAGADASLTVESTTLSATGVPGTTGADSSNPEWMTGNPIGYDGFGGTPPYSIPPFSELSPDHQALLSQGIFTFDATGQFTLKLDGLTRGHTYLFQTFTNDSQNLAPIRRAVVVNGGRATSEEVIANTAPNGAPGGTGQYLIGTFTADGTSQDLSYQAAGTGGSIQINAFQLRDISAIQKRDAK